jgi:hypothetical protein
MGEVVEVELHLGSSDTHDVADLLRVNRLTIGGQTHQLVLVAILREAEELGEGGVKDPKRVREAGGTLDVDIGALAHAPHDAAEIAEAVHRDHRGFIERRREEGARQVGAVVLYEVQARALGSRHTGSQ